mmetsp:Transcript_48164/g.114609  ORF Transcript_48164/g.114609 Transcript_48164/m.114609 type:complete len:229 (+) Transcript_48164:194-880(+)
MAANGTRAETRETPVPGAQQTVPGVQQTPVGSGEKSTFMGTVAVNFYPPEVDEDPAAGVEQRAPPIFVPGNRVILQFLQGDEARFNAQPGIIESCEDALYLVCIDQEYQRLNVPARHLKDERITWVTFQGDQYALTGPYKLSIICKKETGKEEVQKAVHFAIHNKAVSQVGLDVKVVVSDITFQGNALQSGEPFRWVEAGATLEVKGEIDTTKPAPPPPPPSGCCTVQ